MEQQPQAPTDAELVRLVLLGKTEAFDTLLARHRRFVFKIVGRHVPRDQVEEVAQDVFVRAFTSLAGYSGRAEFEHWLSRLAVRSCYAFWREAYRRRETAVSTLSEQHQTWMAQALADQAGQAFQQGAAVKEAREVLAWALAQLSPENRMVLTLVYLDGYSVKEAAALLGWSQVNVKVRAHRARVRLRKLLLNAGERA